MASSSSSRYTTFTPWASTWPRGKLLGEGTFGKVFEIVSRSTGIPTTMVAKQIRKTSGAGAGGGYPRCSFTRGKHFNGFKFQV